ncbi:MAG: hypothetical protein ACJ763_12715 [Bdellovibrionia bacterium]
MRMPLIFIFCCLVIAALFFDRKLAGVDHKTMTSRIEETVSKSEMLPEAKAFAQAVSSGYKNRDEGKSQDSAGIRVSAENQVELQRCGLPFGSDVKTMDDVIQGLSRESGKAEKRALIWRNVHFKSPDGEERRLRVWRDFSIGLRGKLRAQLYTLDEEGLPVPLEQEQDAEKSLEGAKIHETQEKVSLTFGEPKHLSLSIEMKNGSVRSFEAKDDSMAFQCFTAPGSESADCKCLGRAD